MQIIVREANFKELDFILQLQKECYLSEAELYADYDIPPLIQDLKSMENDLINQKILIGELNDRIVASVRGFNEKDTCHIGRLIVDKEFQNKGIAKIMMKAIESDFNECKRFELFTGHLSIKNILLYKKLGYTLFKEHQVNTQLRLIYLEKLVK